MNETDQVDYASLLTKMHYFLDFEASGLHPDSYPIEVGVYGGNGRNSPSYDSLIVPVSYWEYWNFDSQDVHKIERPTLFEQGRIVAEVTADLNRLYEGQVLWADSAYDAMWMGILYEASPHEPTFTVDNIYRYIPEEKWASFRRFLPEIIVHRAYQDAVDIKAAWQKFIKSEMATA